ncbi:ComF family protein [Anaerotignum lactatifermentans]|uniref:ComF family protein n=1 Tax=Anaerotignum lactatifermentans TaxID=160404 RepID=A0ABS2G9D3_9FIRM|nr:ComF family protein [Anaerotignum lactatifermentans]MBM6829597.1 ComF family protein [Anaerotignum lactatifermentans]MBM6878091.1 ComF family protein [Anaerotignum lactatifermentans]MBM6951079.1 ComF family protein [Anaerotignum lactatifermentans]
MKDWKKIIREFFFPPHCLICGEVLALEERGEKLCPKCLAHIPFLTGDQCAQCGRTIPGKATCHRCMLEDFPFSRGAAAFSYEVMRKPIACFKFQGYRYDGAELGGLMARYLKERFPDWIEWTDMMAAVPLHPRKRKKRGFNQADLLCRKISAETGMVYVPDLLRRVIHTRPQSSLNAAQRRENLKDAFALAPGAQVEGRHILLVDDIFTTGSTLRECSRVLLRLGAAEVRVFCLSVVEDFQSV